MRATIDEPMEIAALRTKAAFYCAPGRVLTLDPMAQPIASEMQDVIQFQQRQLDHAAEAIERVLIRIGSVDPIQQHLGVGTQTFEDITAAYADIKDLPVDQVRNDVIPGSAAIHRRKEEEAV